MLPTTSSLGLANEIATVAFQGGQLSFTPKSAPDAVITLDVRSDEGSDFLELRAYTPDRNWVGASVNLRRASLCYGALEMEPSSVTHSSGGGSDKGIVDAQVTIELLTVAIEAAGQLDQWMKPKLDAEIKRIAAELQADRDRRDREHDAAEANGAALTRHVSQYTETAPRIRVTTVDGVVYTGHDHGTEGVFLNVTAKDRVRWSEITKIEIGVGQFAPYRVLNHGIVGIRLANDPSFV